MKTLYININGENVSSTENVFVIGGEKEKLKNKCCYELGKVLLEGIYDSEISKIAKQDLVLQFERYNHDAFKLIDNQLEVIHYKVLGKQPVGTFKVNLPPQYIEWLKRGGNTVFDCVAKQLEQKGNVIDICIDNIYKRVLADVVKHGTNGCNQFVVNDNTVTDDSALVIAIQYKMNDIAFLPYEEWVEDFTIGENLCSTVRNAPIFQSLGEESDKSNSVKEFIQKNNVDKSNRIFHDVEKTITGSISKSLAELKMCSSEGKYKSSNFIISTQVDGNLLYNINGVDVLMVKVNGGAFQMGGTEEQGKDSSFTEKPVHKVMVDDFYMSDTVVTQKLWRVVMGKHQSQFKGDDRPVTNVSYNDCMEFVRRLSSITGKNFRLPTEEEWEFAARGGNNSSKYKYSGSDRLEEIAWYVDNANSVTHDVKKKLPNALGLYDMSGNVWEWCSTLFHKYGQIPQGSLMITRGGCATSTSKACRTSRRYYCDPTHKSCYLGIRLAL